jgi:putative SOS response-associated peptidase YedK
MCGRYASSRTRSDLLETFKIEEALADSTLPGQSKLTPHGRLALEQTRLDGYDVDLMHVPRRTFAL